MIRNIFILIALSAFFLNKPVFGGRPGKIIFDAPLESSCLCGQIRHYGDREGLEGALIEEVAPDFEQVIRSTRSGKKGYFRFSKAPSKEFHYICVSNGPQFRTACYTVKISKKVKEKMIIEIVP